MIDTVSIIFMALEGILAIGVPLFCTIYFIRKYQISWKPILIGILVFIVFSQILEQMLHLYVFEINPYISEWLKNPYLFALYGCLATAVFAEIGRYIGFRYLLKKYRDWKDGIAYGIGHGGAEVLLFVAGVSISLIVNASMNYPGNQLINSPAYMHLITGIGRVFVFTHHLGFSLLVLYSVRNREMKFLLYAILAHAVVYFVTAILQQFHFNIFIIEGFNCVVAIVAVIFIVKSKSLFKNRQI